MHCENRIRGIGTLPQIGFPRLIAFQAPGDMIDSASTQGPIQRSCVRCIRSLRDILGTSSSKVTTQALSLSVLELMSCMHLGGDDQLTE
jgi:hypothetical protein